MKLTAPLALIFSALLSLTSAAVDIRGHIPPTQLLPNPSKLPSSTTFTLTTAGVKDSTTLRTDNSFVFRNINEGSYLLETVCSTHHFQPLRVDVSRDGEVKVHVTFRGNAWSNLGPKVEGPLELRPLKATEYYVVREGFSPLKMLSSPMILIAVVSLVSIIFLPKMMDQLDPEFKAELEQQQKKTGAVAANPLEGFDMASFLAGTSSSKKSAPTQGKKKN
ncbi:hypothetical protein EDC01DRAFT_660969 [Geopyxis carbonaria]|nr:hypothetical protein EDC01DRAFT_660969 [Geopyxis carbonaria]